MGNDSRETETLVRSVVGLHSTLESDRLLVYCVGTRSIVVLFLYFIAVALSLVYYDTVVVQKILQSLIIPTWLVFLVTTMLVLIELVTSLVLLRLERDTSEAGPLVATSDSMTGSVRLENVVVDTAKIHCVPYRLRSIKITSGKYAMYSSMYSANALVKNIVKFTES